LGSLVRAALACHDVAVALGTPFISGKDSLNNEFRYHDASGARSISIPPSLLISALGQVDDAGNLLYAVGVTKNEMGGSHFARVHGLGGGQSPQVNPAMARRTFAAVHASIRAGLVRACHDLSEGGLAVAAAEMAFAGGLGAAIDVAICPHAIDAAQSLDAVLLFAESNSRFLCEVPEKCAEAFERELDGVPHARIGRVTGGPTLEIAQGQRVLLVAELAALKQAQRRTQNSSMAQPRVLILRAPGTNCDVETAHAFECAGGRAERLHVNRLLESPRRLAEFQILCIPGGFSYGDDVAAGRILANQLRHHLADSLGQFQADGKLILGICNGFQILLRSGVLLPLAADSTAPATLAWNASGRFEDRWSPLFVASNKSLFFEGIDTMYLPVAHAEGKFVPRDLATLAALHSAGQIVLRYGLRNAAGDPPTMAPSVAYPDNPNGSLGDVAGICDSSGRVCGLMPHPERHLDPTQHPRWTRGPLPAAGDGLRVFQNAVAYFR
jgi:phosphoribosylformylglycinamidine synthase